MRKVFIVSAVILLLQAPYALAGGNNDCVVDPNPVIKPGAFTISADGGTPAVWYYVRTDWKNQSFGHHPDGLAIADEAGHLVFDLHTDTHPDNIIPIGSVRARVYQADGGGVIARCTFEVVNG